MRSVLTFVLSFFAIAGYSQSVVLPIDSVRYNPFAQKRDLVGTKDIVTVYDAVDWNDNHFLKLNVMFFGDTQNPNATNLQSNTTIDLNLPITGRRVLTSISADTDGDGKEELFVAYETGNRSLRLWSARFAANYTIENTNDLYVGQLNSQDFNLLYDNQSTMYPSFYGHIELDKWDVNGDGKEEVFLGYYNEDLGVLEINVFGNSSVGGAFNLLGTFNQAFIQPTSGFANNQMKNEAWRFALGDFDYDRKPELVITAYGAYLGGADASYVQVVRCEMFDASSISFQLACSTTLENYSIGMFDLEIADITGDLIPEIVLAARDYDSFANQDQIHLYMLNVGDDATASPGQVNFLEKVAQHPYSGNSITIPNLSYYEQDYNDLYNSSPFPFPGELPLVFTFDMKSGDFNNDLKQDLIFSNGQASFVLPGNVNINAQWAFGLSDFSNDMNTLRIPGVFNEDLIRVVDITMDGKPEIINTCNLPISNWSQSLRTTFYNVFFGQPLIQPIEFEQQDFDIDNIFSTATTFSSIAGDFLGDDFQMGRPQQYNLQGVIQPIVVLNAPPIHSDAFGEEVIDLNSCFDTGCSFTSTYYNENNSTLTIENEVRSDWSVGAEVGGGGSIGIVNVSASLSTTYGQGFANTQASVLTYSQVSEITTFYRDLVFCSISNYDVREYPVYRNGQIATYILSIVPKEVNYQWTTTDSDLMLLYRPNHEPGNILSYRNTNEDLENEIGASLYSNTNYQISPSSSYSWEFSQSTTQISSLQTTTDLAIEASVNMDVLGFSAGITGAYSVGSISTHKTEIQNQTKIGVSMNSFNNPDFNGTYDVFPIIYWKPNGHIVLDYTTTPAESSLGTENLWDIKYTQHDPAFNLPWSLDSERGFNATSATKKRQTKSIWMTDPTSGKQIVNPTPGSVVRIHARIYNYSINPTSAPVEVSFFMGHPDLMNGSLLTGQNGETSVFTASSIEPQSFLDVSMLVELPEQGLNDGRLYGFIDPQEEWNDEVHERNNLGWIALGVHYNLLTETTVGVEEFARPTTSLTVFPNPTSGALFIRLSERMDNQARLMVYDQMGKKIIEEKLNYYGNIDVLHQVDLHDLAKGLYQVVLINGDRQKQAKVIIE